MQQPGGAITTRSASAICACITNVRLLPYFEDCAHHPPQEREIAAVRLYQWNAQVAGALMVPIHLCEVAVRSAAAAALAAVYGDHNWPENEGFRRSLRDTERAGQRGDRRGAPAYSPTEDLRKAVRKYKQGEALWTEESTQHVVAELNLVFWVKLYAANHHTRLWQDHLRTVFPHLPTDGEPAQWRDDISSRLDNLRKLRNLVAHHELLYRVRNASGRRVSSGQTLPQHVESMRVLMGYRSVEMLHWFNEVETISALLRVSPVKLSPGRRGKRRTRRTASSTGYQRQPGALSSDPALPEPLDSTQAEGL